MTKIGMYVALALGLAASTAAEAQVNLHARSTTEERAAGALTDLRSARPARDTTALAVRRTGKVVIDGRLDEAPWQSAPVNDNFWQRAPREGGPPQLETSFRVLYDDQAIYVAVRAADHRPHLIRALLTRRDQTSASDWITIGLDTYFDRRTAFLFSLNPAGVKRDLVVYDDVDEDETWDAIWEGVGRIDSAGWTAEFRIPFQQLRFSTRRDQVWGIQVARTVNRTQELTVWQPWPKDSPQNVSLYGTLRGIRGVERGRHLELVPYGKSGLNAGAETGAIYGLGLDARYGLASNTTLTATVNPDFGQVEADPSEVNLTAFETFQAERRPFFLEGAEIFRVPIGDNPNELLFYSRRIGDAPSLAPSGQPVEAPNATTIYGAGKLSGKTPGGWSFGLIEALTAPEQATIVDDAGARSAETIEPLTSYSMLRLTKDTNGGRTTMGGSVTGVHRNLDDPALEAALHDQAYAGGLQMSHRFDRDRWLAQAQVFGSWVHGDEQAIALTQRQPQRYFQRPDADHVDFDPTRTSLAGLAWHWSLFQRSHRHWRYGAGSESRSPGFEINDTGYQQLADHFNQWGWLQYRDDTPGEVVRNYSFDLNVGATTNWDPELLSYRGALSGRVTLHNQWEAAAGGSYDRRLWDQRRLRGGPKMRVDDLVGGWGELWSDSRRRLQAGLSSRLDMERASGSYFWDIQPAMEWHLRSNFMLGVDLRAELRRNATEYVATSEDGDGQPRYVVGRIDQRTAALTLRLDYTYSPRLSLQLYVSPFLTSGRYGDFKEVVEPGARARADRFRDLGADGFMAVEDRYEVDGDGDGAPDYAFARPDFDFGQARSNLVLRWEWLPGSTLFFIWTHERTALANDGRFALGEELGSLRDAEAHHVLLAKLSYWIGL